MYIRAKLHFFVFTLWTRGYVVLNKVYTHVVSWHFISRYIKKNIYEILDQTKVSSIVINRKCPSINGRSLEFTLTIPLITSTSHKG